MKIRFTRKDGNFAQGYIYECGEAEARKFINQGAAEPYESAVRRTTSQVRGTSKHKRASARGKSK